MADTPQGSHPTKEVWLDAQSLRGLAHPVRLRLLSLLREHGPSTATALAQMIGHSSGVTSYHLRQLEAYGFVEEDTARGNRRERWWRATHRTTHYELDDLSDPETAALGEEYLRSVARGYADRVTRFLDGTPTLESEMGKAWTQSWTISDVALALTPAEAQRLLAEIEVLLSAYPQAEPGRPAGDRERVVVQYQVLPQAPPPITEGQSS